VKTTLEKSGEDVKTTLETSGQDVKTTLGTSVVLPVKNLSIMYPPALQPRSNGANEGNDLQVFHSFRVCLTSSPLVSSVFSRGLHSFRV
jgi:hypothetical protein